MNMALKRHVYASVGRIIPFTIKTSAENSLRLILKAFFTLRTIFSVKCATLQINSSISNHVYC